MPEPSDSKPTVEFIPISVEKYSSAARFLDQQHKPIGEQLWTLRFEHWWDKNPAFSDESPRGWALQTGTEIVGFIGVIPTWMTTGDQKVLVYSLTTWVVRADHRNESLRLFMEAQKLAKENLIFNTSATDEMITFMKRFKYQNYLAGEHLRSYVAVLHPIAAAWFKLSGATAPALLKPLDQMLGLFANTPKLPSDYTFRSIEAAQVDALWEKARADYPFTNVRDAQTIQWWLSAPPQGSITAWGVFSKDADSPLAAALFIQLDRAVRVWECIDYFEHRALGPDQRSVVQSAMIAGTIAHAKGYLKHIDALSFPQHSGLFRRMSGLRETKRSNNNKLYFSRNKELVDLVQNEPYLTNQGDMYL